MNGRSVVPIVGTTAPPIMAIILWLERNQMQLCFTCGKRPRRTWRDSMCRECRNAYVALWKAKKRHGDELDGYNPRGPRAKAPVRRLRGTPTERERKEHGL